MIDGTSWRLSGAVPLLPTPFTSDGAVDHEAFRDLLDWGTGGFEAVAMLGLGGECFELSSEERMALVDLAVRESHAALVIGCTADSASDSIGLVRHAASLGVHAVMVAAPRRLPAEFSADHFFDEIVEAAGSTLVMVQDAPTWTSGALGTELLDRLTIRHPEVVVYAKPESPLYVDATVAAASTGSVRVFSGIGGVTFLDALACGAHGVIPFAESAGRLREVFELWPADSARAEFERLLPLLSFQFQSLEFAIVCSKTLLALGGRRMTTRMRIPSAPLSAMSTRLLVEHARLAGVLPSQ